MHTAKPSDLDHLADLVSAIGSPDFDRTFYTVFRTVFGIEECTVFSFAAPDRPEKLLVESASDTRRETASRLAGDYVAGGYRRDPNVRGLPSFVSVHTLDTSSIDDSDYRAHYYDAPSLGHELVMLGREAGMGYYASFYRRKDELHFSQADVRLASEWARFVVKALHRHHQLVRSSESPTGLPLTPAADDRHATLIHLREVLLASPTRLSPREAEVCAGIVLGYSTEAISLNCSITANTVATHRKRAYAKLGISSQNELFARYFSIVRGIEARHIN